ncbi:hypothetical protein M153_20010000436 [Pseudoloma neurophilia]|uniref:Uncharacterized protein n=1 Tax=Pseudoloma neurophilia TaxID=146866 RepID=A0A0R0LQV1_9MICR|nr:hypothetical protein M153_20010000436 [Pseudoloma neurophilia]
MKKLGKATSYMKTRYNTLKRRQMGFLCILNCKKERFYPYHR